MNYESFISIENEKVVFIECWLDRCIDRNGEYIPSYPYWNNSYTPHSWFMEGETNCMQSAYFKIKPLSLNFIKSGFSVEEVIIFDGGTEYKPDNETGWDVYSKDEFLILNHSEIGYEGYVYYGYSKIVFGDNTSKEDVINHLNKVLN